MNSNNSNRLGKCVIATKAMTSCFAITIQLETSQTDKLNHPRLVMETHSIILSNPISTWILDNVEHCKIKLERVLNITEDIREREREWTLFFMFDVG